VLLCEALQRDGFELAMHTASSWDNTRERTLLAYDRFRAVFGGWPITNIMHGRNRENLYWGAQHLESHRLWRGAALLHSRFARYRATPFEGHIPGSLWFWGDICLERSRYVRFFETIDADTLRFDPATPYHDPTKPFVPFWFSATHGGGHRVVELLTGRRLDELAANRGAAIFHAYLSLYSEGGRVLPAFAAWSESVARRGDVWFVPVATLLDRLRVVRGLQVVASGNRVAIYNPSSEPLVDAALEAPADVVILSADGRNLSKSRNRLGQVPLGAIGPGRLVELYLSHPVTMRGSGLVATPSVATLALGTALRTAFKHAELAKVRGLRPEGNSVWRG